MIFLNGLRLKSIKSSRLSRHNHEPRPRCQEEEEAAATLRVVVDAVSLGRSLWEDLVWRMLFPLVEFKMALL